MERILSFLTTKEPVRLVVNDTLPEKPLVTMLANADGTPKEDALGKVIGSIRLEQHSSTLNGSFLNARRRTAFIAGNYEDLMARVKKFNLENGSVVPGKIQILESLEPFWKGQTPKINPQTEETIGVRNGESFYPVYMQMKYSEDETVKDKLIRTMDDVVAWYSTREVLKQNAGTVVNESAGIPKAGAVTEQ